MLLSLKWCIKYDLSARNLQIAQKSFFPLYFFIGMNHAKYNFIIVEINKIKINIKKKFVNFFT